MKRSKNAIIALAVAAYALALVHLLSGVTDEAETRTRAVVDDVSVSSPTGVRLVVRVVGVKSDAPLYVALFASGDGFPGADEKAFRRKIARPDGAECKVVFDAMPAGVYAVSCYQDLNRNGRIDKWFFGKPREPYGISRAGDTADGIPGFDAASFPVRDADNTITIELRD